MCLFGLARCARECASSRQCWTGPGRREILGGRCRGRTWRSSGAPLRRWPGKTFAPCSTSTPPTWNSSRFGPRQKEPFHGRQGVEKFIADTLENFETFEPHYELRDLDERVLAWGTI